MSVHKLQIPLRLSVVAVVTAAVALGAPALAMAATRASKQFAGYALNGGVGTSTVVQSTIVVPKLKCGSGYQGITADAGTGAEVNTKSESSSAGVVLACQKGVPYYFPAINLNSATTHNYPAIEFHPGDKVVLRVSENTDSTAVSVKDTTLHKGKVLTGGGATKVGYPWVGDEAQLTSSGPAPVPNFGTVTYSNATVNGGSLASFTRFNRVSSGGILQIKTGPLAGNGESFSTVYKHS